MRNCILWKVQHLADLDMQDKFEERIKKMLKIKETMDAEQGPEELRIVNGAKQRHQVSTLLCIWRAVLSVS